MTPASILLFIVVSSQHVLVGRAWLVGNLRGVEAQVPLRPARDQDGLNRGWRDNVGLPARPNPVEVERQECDRQEGPGDGDASRTRQRPAREGNAFVAEWASPCAA